MSTNNPKMSIINKALDKVSNKKISELSIKERNILIKKGYYNLIPKEKHWFWAVITIHLYTIIVFLYENHICCDAGHQNVCISTGKPYCLVHWTSK